MKSLIKDNVVNFVCDKRKIIILVIFAWFCGDEIILADSLDMSVYEYIMLVMGNHYYIIYFLLMSYLFFRFEQIKKTSNCVDIRIKHIKNKYLVQLLTTIIQTTIFVFVHFVIAFFIGVTRLEPVNKFQIKTISGYYNDTLSFVYGYQKFFSNPFWALMVIGLYMVLGLTLYGMMIYVVNEIKGNKITLIMIGCLIFDIMFGFKLNIHGIMEVFFANNYFILHHVLFMNRPVWVLINIVIIGLLIFVMYIWLKRKTGNHITKNKYVRYMMDSTYKVSAIFLGIYIVLNCFSVYLQDNHFYALDGMIVNLLGYSKESTDLLELIKHILFFAIPLFFAGKFLENEIQMYNDQIKIRYKNKSQWNRLINGALEIYVWIYATVFNVFMLIFYLLSILQTGLNDLYLNDFLNYMGIAHKELGEILILSCALKTLELIYYKNVLLLLTSLLKNRIVAYLLTLSGFILSFISGTPIISYGRSSLYYLCDNVHRYGIEKLGVLLLSILIIKNIFIKIIIRRRLNE